MPLQGKTRQIDRLLAYLRQFGSITKAQGHVDLAIENVAGRILDLKKIGIPLRLDWEEGQNRFGETTHYRRWVLVEEEQQRLTI